MKQRPTIGQLLDEQVRPFDELVSEAAQIRSATHYDELEAKAREHARAVIDAFRRGRP